MKRLVIWFCIHAAAGSAVLYAQGAAQLPNAPGSATVKKVCGTCHSPAVVLGKGMTREQWGGIVSNMISRGAKGTDDEFAQIVDYLSQNLPPKSASVATGAGAAKPVPPKRGRSLIDQAGSADKQIVDEAAADRGKKVYIAECVTCHGPKGRGTDKGADLVRSVMVLRDRYDNLIGPYLAKGHPTQSNPSGGTAFTKEQIEDLSHFIHQKVGDTLRTGPYNKVLNVLTGDAKAGAAYFNGAGKCSTCHSPTGDLAGIGKKYEPPVLQLKTVFPQTAAFGRRSMAGSKKPVTVTVTTPSGEKVNGALEEMDDFSVSLRDESGQYRTFDRTPELKVEKHDPYAGHVALLDQYTDKEIHDVVAYLETLK